MTVKSLDNQVTLHNTVRNDASLHAQEKPKRSDIWQTIEESWQTRLSAVRVPLWVVPPIASRKRRKESHRTPDWITVKFSGTAWSRGGAKELKKTRLYNMLEQKSDRTRTSGMSPIYSFCAKERRLNLFSFQNLKYQCITENVPNTFQRGMNTQTAFIMQILSSHWMHITDAGK